VVDKAGADADATGVMYLSLFRELNDNDRFVDGVGKLQVLGRFHILDTAVNVSFCGGLSPSMVSSNIRTATIMSANVVSVSIMPAYVR
jgi:hypothetical protein